MSWPRLADLATFVAHFSLTRRILAARHVALLIRPEQTWSTWTASRYAWSVPMNEIWQLSATDLARRVARRQLSSAEVVDAHLARIDAVNPALNAVVRVLAEQAREAADLADRRLAAGESVGPLHGVPFTV